MTSDPARGQSERDRGQPRPTVLERLRLVGVAVHGEHWQRAMARSLGTYHPRGPRERIDDRLLRRWVAMEVSVPAWVGRALPFLLRDARTEFMSRIDACALLLGGDEPDPEA